MKCPSCRSEIPEKLRYCHFCGAEIKPEHAVAYSDFPPGTLIICPKCGTRNARTEMRCTKCDADLLETKKTLAGNVIKEPERHPSRCLNCGTENPVSANFCGFCGWSIPPGPMPGPSAGMPVLPGHVEGWIAVLCYIVSFFGPPFGVVIGAVFYTAAPHPESEYRRVGEMCFILALAGIILWAVISMLWMATV